jgi:hypothetical protein
MRAQASYRLFFLLFACTPPASGWREAALREAGLSSAENELAVTIPSAFSLQLSPNYTLSATPSSLSDGEMVSVIYNTSTPKFGDWVGLYTAGADIQKSSPIKFFFVDDASYLTLGKGTRRLQLVSMRSAYFTLYYFTNNLSAGIARGALNVSILGDPLAPQRPRLGVENASHLRLTWGSGRSPASAAPSFSWGVVESTALASPPIASSHLDATAFCGAPANDSGYSDLGWVHSALLDLTLAPSRPHSLWYVFGDALAGPSAPTIARVPSAPGVVSYPHTLVAFDDLGRGSLDDAATWNEYGRPSVNTSSFLSSLKDGIEAVWLVGDVSYATGYLAVWDWWLFMVAPWVKGVALLLGVGNHESGIVTGPGGPSAASHFSYFSTRDSGGECGVATTHLVPLPGSWGKTPQQSADAPWWVFSTGPFTLLTLSSEHSLLAGSPQLAWVEATLAAINRTAAPFVIVGVHRPMYIDSTYATDGRSPAAGLPDTADTPVSALLQRHLEPLTMRFKVSLAIYGHNHAVQRLTPAYRNVSVQRSAPHVRPDGNASALFFRPTATLHFVAGTGGAGFTVNCAACSPSSPQPPPSFSERVFYAWGVLKITAVNASALHLDWVNTATGAVDDRVTLLQDLAQPWADEGGGGSSSGGSSSTTPSPLLSAGAVVGACVGVFSGLALLVLLAACLRARGAGVGASLRSSFRTQYTILSADKPASDQIYGSL